jgi:hypothetical protein
MQKFLIIFLAAFLLPFFISAQPVVTSATRVKLFKGDSIFTAPLSGLASAIGAGGNRPDSAFAIGAYATPGYWSKTVNSNLWKKGTLSFRTADTTGMLTLHQADSANLKPSLYFSGDGEYIWKIKKDSRSGTGTDFNFVRKYGPSGSDGLNNNQIFAFGWNVAPGGGMENPSFPSCSYRIEENFKNGVNNANAFECHLPHIEFSNNTGRRPLSGYFSRNHINPTGNWSFSSDFITFSDYQTNTPKGVWAFGTNTGYVKGITFADTANVMMAKNNVGGLWQRNAADNAFIRMLMVDNEDRILLGASGPASRVAAYNEVQITNGGYLWNELAELKIGKNTSTEGVITYFNSESNDNVYFSNPLASNYLRIGTTNEGSGNYMTTLFSATGERYFQARQDVSDRLLNLAGSKVAINAYAPSQTQTFTVNGTTQLGTGSDANANSILNLKTNAYNADIFVNNQSPEALSTSAVGGIALINDGGVGALYGKYSGSGNTGWAKFLNMKDPNGASTNQVLQWNGTTWGPASVGGIGGSGTTNFVTKFTGPNSIGNSTITDDGTDVGFNWGSKVRIYFSSNYNMGMQRGTGRDLILFANSPDNDAKVSLVAANITALTADHLGNVGIGTTSPSASYKLDIIGKARAQGLRAEGTTMQPSLELANTTPTTGKTFTLGSSNTGNFYISSDVAGDAISVTHATGDVTITPKLKLTTVGTVATSLVGRNAATEVAGVTIGSGLGLTAGTLSATDASTTNELQTLSNTSDATSHTATLSNSGGSLKLVEGSNITIATTGTALDGIVTISATGGGSSPVIITPAAITVDQNNYSPTDWSTATIVRISGTTQIWGITGFSSSGFSGGHTKRIINVGAKSIYFAGEHPSSTAANRISATNDFVLGAKKSMNIIFDATLSRWIIEGTERVPEIEHNWSAASQTGSEFENTAFTAIGTGTVNTGGNAATEEPATTKISTGTTSSGGGSITLGKTVAPIATRLGHKYVEGYFTLLSTSNASNRYTAGLIISTTTTGTFGAANTCGVRYTDNVNSGRWELYSINNGGTTVTQDLGITVSSAPTKIRIEMDDAGATIRAYLNEEMKGQISGSSSLPTEFGNYFGKLQIIKSVGTTAVVMDCYSMKSGIHTY